MIRLRGHHLFCCTLFQGSGYDGTFASRMAQILERLQAGEEICLVEGCDDVCAACPNRRGEAGCALGTENVARRDAAARQATGVSLGEEFFPGEAGKNCGPFPGNSGRLPAPAAAGKRRGCAPGSFLCSFVPSALCKIPYRGRFLEKNRAALGFFENALAFGRRIY